MRGASLKNSLILISSFLLLVSLLSLGTNSFRNKTYGEVYHPNHNKDSNLESPSTTDSFLTYDICGVLHGDSSSCAHILRELGLDDPDEPTGLRNRLIRYVNIHHRILDPNDTTVPKKFVHFVTGVLHGMGNRISGIIGSFLVALLTDRAFLLEWREHKPVQFGTEFMGMAGNAFLNNFKQ